MLPSNFKTNDDAAFLYKNGIDPYNDPARAGRVRLIVVTIHVLIIVVPFVWFAISSYLNPPKIVMKVALVDLPEGNTLDKSAPVKPAAQKLPKNNPQPEVKETKEEVKKPEVKQTEVKKPEVKKEPKKPEPKPAPKKPEVKKEPKKAEKPKLLTADQIKKSGKKVTKQDNSAERKAAEKAAAKASAERRAAVNAVKKELYYGSVAGGEKGILLPKEFQDYYAKLDAWIRPQWKEPSSSSLNGEKPTVTISLSIDDSGRITSAKLLEPSGNAAMDASARELVSRLKVAPKPPRAINGITISLNVR